jgi:hypothetical protein
MKRSSFIKAIALCGIAAMVLATSAQAQVNKDDAKCRATLNKGTGKMASTANKAVVGCIKDRLKGKNSTNDCTDPTTADSKGKIGGARSKLTGSSAKCVGLPSSYVTCPSPGTAGAVASAGDATGCLADVVEPAAGVGSVELFWKETLNADLATLADAALTNKDVGKCVNDIAKNAGKLYDTYIKVAGKLVQTSDKAEGPYPPSTNKSSDDKGKVAKAKTKLSDAITKSCLSLDQSVITALGSCSRTVGELAGCIGDIATKNASGVNSSSFAMPGVCPTSVSITGEGTFNGAGIQTATSLSSGSTGLGHNAEVPEGFRGGVDLVCSDGTCSSCSVLANCVAGNCRCAGSPGTLCDEPFGPDPDCPAAAECILYFGPPLPLSAGGTPACVVNRIPQELNGTANIGNGSSVTTVTNFADVYASGTGGFSVSSPCPECIGDATANDGAKGGTCTGGLNNGAPCDINFINPTLGDTSYDCQPDSSPSTLRLPITLSEQDKTQPFGVQSTFNPLIDVPCNVCSGDTQLACNSDTVCNDAGAGLCNSNGAGTPTLPNACGDLDCGADGLCVDGSSNLFCDGYLKQSGDGIIACDDDGACTALDPACPGGDCGNCTLASPKSCFPDPTNVTGGVPGQNGAILTGAFCTPPTGTGIDGAAGQPGLSTLSIEFDFTGLCADGLTEFELGGNNCP